MVQVKARSGLRINNDGSLSLRIESQNVEYLLNAAGSTIVLYDADRKAFYWANVLEEVLALREQGINYRDQKKVTVRFSRKLGREPGPVLPVRLLPAATARCSCSSTDRSAFATG